MIDSAGFDVRVVGSVGLSMLRLPDAGAAKLADEIRRLPEVEEVALVRIERASAMAPNRPERGVALVGTTESSARGAWTLIRGSDLAADPSLRVPPVLVARRLASLFGLEPGSTLRLRVTLPGVASVLPAVDCRVVGIADFSFEGTGAFTVATTLEAFDVLYGGGARDEADLVLVASRPEAGANAAVAAIARARPDLGVYSNEQVIAQFNQNGFAYFRQISLVLSTTTLVFTFLLVAVLLTVSVNQRLGEIAALRAIGISPRRVAAMLLWESVLLVGIGGAAALPLGGALAVGLDGILRRIPGLPERLHFFVFDPRAVVLHVAWLSATALVAALYPMWLAVKLPIAETLRREVVS
jgi:putative ABC transport system permease protein